MRSRSFAIEAVPELSRIPNLLAFDASLAAVSAAVVCRREGDAIAREAFEPRSGEHAAQLMAMIEAVMREAGVTFAMLERIAVTIGPGSFTGVRVGIAAARGLGLASGHPVVGASSLAVMAREAVRLLPTQAARGLAVAVDAGRGMVYFQLFEPGPAPASPPLYLAPTEAQRLLGARDVLLVGSGADAVGSAVAAAGGRPEATLPSLQPRARALLPLGAAAASDPVRPLYLRPHGAKEPAGSGR
jgi:tRNA threonylcarbamoyladenosine biosynthesis protein TsaB